jgi:hypothetical protein
MSEGEKAMSEGDKAMSRPDYQFVEKRFLFETF